MRWQFPDYADADESQRRRAAVATIDRWWAAFAAEAHAIDAHFSRAGDADVVGLMAGLAEVDPRIMWEFGRAVGKDGHRLCLTVEGRHALRPLLSAVLARAPRLPRWEFHAARLAEPFAEFRGAVDSRVTVDGTGVVVTVTPGRANRVDVRYHFPPAAWPADAPAAQKYAFLATERLLGEDRLDRWVGGVEATLDPPGAAPLLLERLAGTVDAAVADVLADLPAQPRHLLDGYAAAEGALFKRDPGPDRPDYPGWSDLAFASAPEPDLWQATHAGGFHSGRYSRCGETFCYLKLDGMGGLKGRVADRGRLEDALTAALTAAGLGCALGGGTGRVYSYVDLALTDVEAAVPVVRDVLCRRNVHRRSWLLFYDAEYADEWVGVWRDTPPPPSDPA